MGGFLSVLVALFHNSALDQVEPRLLQEIRDGDRNVQQVGFAVPCGAFQSLLADQEPPGKGLDVHHATARKRFTK